MHFRVKIHAKDCRPYDGPLDLFEPSIVDAGPGGWRHHRRGASRRSFTALDRRVDRLFLTILFQRVILWL